MDLTGDLARYERTLRAHGFACVAGVDEVGRGALAGPLVAAAVILPEDFDLDGIRDSKQLTPAQRERAYERIVSACRWIVRRIEPSVLDARGLHRSNLALLRRCVKALEPCPDYVLTDGFPVRGMPCPSLGVKKGDAVAASIAAASIVAKVTRDREMRRLHKRFPAYGFAENKGYGTSAHWAVLDALGPSPVHRLSFSGVGQAALPGFSRSALTGERPLEPTDDAISLVRGGSVGDPLDAEAADIGPVRAPQPGPYEVGVRAWEP
jgi:ribonuclease HII